MTIEGPDQRSAAPHASPPANCFAGEKCGLGGLSQRTPHQLIFLVFAGLDALGNKSPYSTKCTAPLAGQRRAAVAHRTFPSPPLAPTISRPVNNNNQLGGNQ